MHARWGDAEVSFQNPFKLDEGLVVKADIIQISDLDPRFLKAVLGGAFREISIMPFPGKSFFLGGGDYFSIADQTGGGVVVKSGYAKYVHRSLKVVVE